MARDLGIAPRRLWGWEPVETHVEDVDDDGRKVIRVTREPEFNAEQHAMLAALQDFEASLGPHGLPLEETTSPDADPDNPHATGHYEARVYRDWAQDAIEQREKDFKDNPSRARMFFPVWVPHS